MKEAPIPSNEKERLSEVQRLGILGSTNDERFDILTREAATELEVPICIVSIIDKDREWYKSCVGLSLKEGRRATSFCGHAMLAQEVFIVEDTLKDERFFDNPQVVKSPKIRFYAGAAIRSRGFPVGVFCIKDFVPRKLNLYQISKLMGYAQKAEKYLSN